MDFMILEIGSQRRFEVFLESGGDVKMIAEFMSSQGEVTSINKLLNARNKRLDELVHISKRSD
jgi:hypothetical protein